MKNLQATARSLYSALPGQIAMIIEGAIYSAMDHTAEDYNGGCWNIRAKKTENGLQITTTFLDGDKVLTNQGAQFTQEVNGKVSGAVSTVIGLNALCHKFHSQGEHRSSKFFADLYYAAKDAALDNLNAEEASQFLSLID